MAIVDSRFSAEVFIGLVTGTKCDGKIPEAIVCRRKREISPGFSHPRTFPPHVLTHTRSAHLRGEDDLLGYFTSGLTHP
jgi:hypothetical protein